MPYKDPEKRRENHRLRYAALRSQYFSDKVCSVCGGTENLELDHINPKDKISHRIWSWSEKRRNAELAKCQPLCRKCHIEKSKSEAFQKYKHGTYSCWRNLGCRCEPCVMAQRVYKRQYRANGGKH